MSEQDPKNTNEKEVEVDLESSHKLEEIAKKLEAKNNKESKDPETESSNEISEENAKLKNEYLYLRAEFDNFRKNAVKERSELIKFGNERLIIDIIEVLDIFDTALSSDVSAENIDSFVEGMKMTASQLKSTLEKFGVASSDPQGEAFDPLLHEALSSEETDKVDPGHITQVFKKAYKLHGKVIRPAQVIVAKEISTTDPETTEQD